MTESVGASLRVLVLCTANAARSQIAEALFQALGGGRIIASSAGSSPGGGPHPLAVAVLAERGIDWSGRTSKGIDAVASERWDLVVTVCDNAREACPVFPGARSLHWGLADPAGSGIEAFRSVADELDKKIRELLDDGGLADR